MQQSFFFQALVFLAAAVVFVPIAKRLGIGSVLGYLIAGVVIGPALLGFIGEEGQDIMHFAEFGVVMMLFIIGLELEPELLWRLRRSIVGLGGLQVLVTAVVIAGLAMLFQLSWQVSLALGFTLSLSSTAIVMQTLNEKNLLKTSAGQSAFSVLLFQDIAVIPMLALFPFLATLSVTHPSGHATTTWVEGMPNWLHALVVLGTVAGIIVAGRYLTRPLLRFMASIRMREIFTATALLLVVGIAVLMTQVGLSPALGTFLAGVVLANSEYRHELESDIEPFKGLFLGLFFIAVGASIDFSLVLSRPLLIIGLVLGIMLLKGLLLFGLGKLFRLRTDQNLTFAFALCEVGEFAFVLLSFTEQEGILPPSLVGIMVAVTAISMALSPIFMMVLEKQILPRLGAKGTEEREDDHFEESNPVIIAGFGHFGNTVGRFLRANRIKATFLDLDSDRVDFLRKMRFKVYYGDASRYELLRSAGADRAKIIVIAIDSPEKRLEMIETIKKHFPNLNMLVRSSHRFDAYDLMNAGMLHVYRENIDTALRLGTDVLEMLGHRTYAAKRAARLFLKHDEATLKKLAAIRNREEYITVASDYMEEMERTIQQDLLDADLHDDDGWETETLIEEAREAEKAG